MPNKRNAARIIKDLIDAGQNDALVPIQDGGANFDIVWSRKNPNRVMRLKESERLMDQAIKAAWKALTGEKLRAADPVDFIYKMEESADAK